MVLNLSKVLLQRADVLQSLRERTKNYLAKFGYTHKAMASAVGISETYLNEERPRFDGEKVFSS
jgi:DNA-binding XRE family transcriptional regulator